MSSSSAAADNLAAEVPVEITVPIQPSDRIASIDVLRGLAVLGILVINIMGFGIPWNLNANPTLLTEFTTADSVMFWLSWVGFEGSQRAIFSMLFGAGIVLLTSRLSSDERSHQQKRIYYRRNIWLMIFGLIDCYLLLWFGDILFVYGLVGLFLYFARNASPMKLTIVAGIIIGVMALADVALTNLVEQSQPLTEQAIEKEAQGLPLTPDEQLALDLAELSPGYVPTQEEIDAAIAERANGYFAAFGPNAKLGFELTVLAGMLMLWWDAAAMMLIGMALFKMRVLDASRKLRTYVLMTTLGLGIGLSINVWETYDAIANDYATMYLYGTYDFGRLAMAIGTIGLVMIVCKTGILAKVQEVLAAVGRMALTNYIAQTIICNLIFVGFGMFGKLSFYQLYYVVLLVWTLQLIYSPLWLKRYRYGPLEWVWRKLTYAGKL